MFRSLAIAVFALLLATAVYAQEPMATPNQFVAAPPGPHRYAEYNTGCYPWYGYGFGVPTYNWGYFGAQYRPACVTHHGYYGDYYQWGYRRGY